MSGIIRLKDNHFTSYRVMRQVIYRPPEREGAARVFQMLESPVNGHFLITLGQTVIEVASTKQEGYRALDAAENVLKAVGWRLVEEVNA